jgi:hypothetical protein
MVLFFVIYIYIQFIYMYNLYMKYKYIDVISFTIDGVKVGTAP